VFPHSPCGTVTSLPSTVKVISACPGRVVENSRGAGNNDVSSVMLDLTDAVAKFGNTELQDATWTRLVEIKTYQQEQCSQLAAERSIEKRRIGESCWELCSDRKVCSSCKRIQVEAWPPL